MAHKKKQRPSLLTRSSRSTIRHTTSPPADFSTAGSQEPKRWEASSAATSLGRLGDTGPTSASRSFSSPTTLVLLVSWQVRIVAKRSNGKEGYPNSYDRPAEPAEDK